MECSKYSTFSSRYNHPHEPSTSRFQPPVGPMHHSPEPVGGFVPPKFSTSTLILHESHESLPRLGNPMGHVRVEARRMKPPVLAACRACATDSFARCNFFASNSFGSPSRVHSPKLECRSPGKWLSKRKNSLVGRGLRNPLAAERLLSWSSLVQPGRLVTCKTTRTDRSCSNLINTSSAAALAAFTFW
jgi:hypothetical protein